MLFHSAEDPRLAEMAFRVVQNSAPMSVTATTAQIALGMPVVMEINTASLPSSDPTVGQNFVTKPAAAATAPINNLFLGVLSRVPGRGTTLMPDAVGLAQIYGPVAALVRRDAAGVAAGSPLVPSDIGFVAAGTGGAPAGLAGMAVLIEALAASAASEMTTARVFLRCM